MNSISYISCYSVFIKISKIYILIYVNIVYEDEKKRNIRDFFVKTIQKGNNLTDDVNI
jgi:hypothetical protein